MISSKLKVQIHGRANHIPLIFLHAFPFSSAMWQGQLEFFSHKFYCVAPDLPGFGDSVLPDHAVTFEHFIDSVLEELKRAKIENAIWCGLSMGGYVALRLFERAPAMCRALILCDTKAGTDGNEAKLKRWSSIQALQKNRSEFVEAQWQALIGESSKATASLKNQFVELASKSPERGIAAGLVALATRTDSTPNLAKIRVPTLIVVGDEDKVTPVGESQAIANAISGSQIKVLEKTGHLSNLENPREFNQCLSTFLASL